MKCFYHSSDLDGICSGAIVKFKYPECEMFPINYGEDFPFSKITPGETVYMVDFSLVSKDMDALTGTCHLVWIDHHKSSIDSVDPRIDGIRRIGLGACALVWEHLFPKENLPIAIRLLAEYDVWDHSDPDTLPFQYGMRLKTTAPESSIWEKLFTGNSEVIVTGIIEIGAVILEYQDQSNAMYAKGAAFETTLMGYRCIAQNKMYSNSQAFDSVFDPDKHDIMLLFGWRHGQWSVSLYSDESGPDVSVIAVGFGGGGHAHASGFSCDILPFYLN